MNGIQIQAPNRDSIRDFLGGGGGSTNLQADKALDFKGEEFVCNSGNTNSSIGSDTDDIALVFCILNRRVKGALQTCATLDK
jgi:hypothetical protein